MSFLVYFLSLVSVVKLLFVKRYPPARSASSGGAAIRRDAANQPAAVTSARRRRAPWREPEFDGHIEVKHFLPEMAMPSPRARRSARPAADGREFGEQVGAVAHARAERAHHREFVAPFLGHRCQRRVENDNSGEQRK